MSDVLLFGKDANTETNRTSTTSFQLRADRIARGPSLGAQIVFRHGAIDLEQSVREQGER